MSFSWRAVPKCRTPFHPIVCHHFPQKNCHQMDLNRISLHFVDVRLLLLGIPVPQYLRPTLSWASFSVQFVFHQCHVCGQGAQPVLLRPDDPHRSRKGWLSPDRYREVGGSLVIRQLRPSRDCSTVEGQASKCEHVVTTGDRHGFAWKLSIHSFNGLKPSFSLNHILQPCKCSAWTLPPPESLEVWVASTCCDATRQASLPATTMPSLAMSQGRQGQGWPTSEPKVH